MDPQVAPTASEEAPATPSEQVLIEEVKDLHQGFGGSSPMTRVYALAPGDTVPSNGRIVSGVTPHDWQPLRINRA